MLFTPWRLEEAAVTLSLYKLYNLVCISFLSIAMIDYHEKKKLWRERVHLPKSSKGATAHHGGKGMG